MDISANQDFFEIYLNHFPTSPSLVLVRSVELKNFPKQYTQYPVLDLCCGDGFFASLLGLKGNIYGCNINIDALKIAKRRGVYKDLKCLDVINLDQYPDNMFNTVISNCALEHVKGLEFTIKEVARVLKKNGTMIISVPSNNLNMYYPGTKEKLALYNKRQAHFNIFSLEDWRIILKQFSILYHYYLFNREQYKLCITLDSLPELLGTFYMIYHLITKFVPRNILKCIWRKKLKTIYLQSQPLLENGGSS